MLCTPTREILEFMYQQQLLPWLEQADTSFEQLCGHCLDCKVCCAKSQGKHWLEFMYQQQLSLWLE